MQIIILRALHSGFHPLEYAQKKMQRKMESGNIVAERPPQVKKKKTVQGKVETIMG